MNRHLHDPGTLSRVLCSAVVLLMLTGCQGRRHAVIAATGTNIGVEISQNPANQSPQAKLGYQRTELAIVPSNRAADDQEQSIKDGATDVADVLIELRYGGIFDFGPTSGIYQRLAVGPAAVTQPGAAFMFARDAKGELDKEAAASVAAALAGVPSARPLQVLHALKPLRKAYAEAAGDPAKKQMFDEAAQAASFADFRSALTSPALTEGQIQTIRRFLEERDPQIKKRLNELDPSR